MRCLYLYTFINLVTFIKNYRTIFNFSSYWVSRRSFILKKKYKFYKNKRTRFHPSIEIESNTVIWKNLEVTSNPTKSGRYIELKKNPSGNPKKAFVRKYIRKDSIKTRGELLKKYNLSEEDLVEIEKFILENANKKS